jgi:hypothetical protein
MSGEEQTGPQGLTGLWHGRFSYPRNLPPTGFTAVLSENGAWIGGVIEETADTGEQAGQTICSTVQGRREGAHIRFLKTYDHPTRARDSVVYEGVLDHDATEIVGRWSIPGNWSGDFIMIRAKATPEAVARRTAERA